jgi:tetratricopeptide (TPR) repeat protein
MGHALRAKTNPDYREAIEWYTKVYTERRPEEAMDTARFRIAECYDLSGQLARARDEYREFIRRFPESHWVTSAESKLGKVLEEIEKETRPDYVTLEGHYQYRIEKQGDGWTVRIRNIQKDLMLARDSGGYPHAFVVPLKLSDVDPDQTITIVVENFPGLLGPIAYIEVATEVQVDGILPSGAAVDLVLSQGSNSISGRNRIVRENLTGIWGGSLYSVNSDYAKPITIRADVGSLGKELLGFGKPLGGGRLLLALLVADPGGVGFKALNEARHKAEYLKYISLLYDIAP